MTDVSTTIVNELAECVTYLAECIAGDAYQRNTPTPTVMEANSVVNRAMKLADELATPEKPIVPKCPGWHDLAPWAYANLCELALSIGRILVGIQKYYPGMLHTSPTVSQLARINAVLEEPDQVWPSQEIKDACQPLFDKLTEATP